MSSKFGIHKEKAIRSRHFQNRAWSMSIDEQLPIDLSLGTDINIRNMMKCILNKGKYNVSLRLCHLNNVIRVLEHYRSQKMTSTILAQMTQMVLSVRCLLTDDCKQIRTASLRLLRYLVAEKRHIDIIVNCGCDLFIARCIDLCEGNELERQEALRLVYTMHCVGQPLPTSIIIPLIALIFDPAEPSKFNDGVGGDTSCMTGLVLLCHMTVQHPEHILDNIGIQWLPKAMLIYIDRQPRVSHCLSAVLCRLLDDPRIRINHPAVFNVILELIAPFSDTTFSVSPISQNERHKLDSRFLCDRPQTLARASQCLLSLMQTWPGLVCVSVDRMNRTGSMIGLLIDSLAVIKCDTSTQVLLECFAKLIHRTYATRHINTWKAAVQAYKGEGNMSDSLSYCLSDEYISGELLSVLHSLSPTPDLILIHQSITLMSLIDAGLAQALIRVVLTNSESPQGLKATVLLADIIKLGCTVLPPRWRTEVLSLPTALAAFINLPSGNPGCRTWIPNKTSPHLTDAVQVLQSRLLSLGQIDVERDRTYVNFGTECMINRYKTKTNDNEMISSRIRSASARDSAMNRKDNTRKMSLVTVPGFNIFSKTEESQGPSVENNVHQLMRDSRCMLPYANPDTWQWDSILLALAQLNSLQDVDVACDKHSFSNCAVCTKFLISIISYYCPSAGFYHKLRNEWSIETKAGCKLFKLLSCMDWEDTKTTQLQANLKQLLMHVTANLTKDRLHLGLFSSKNLRDSPSAEYMTMIGQLSSTKSGEQLLKNVGLAQRLLDLMNIETSDMYIKLLISQLDYSRPGVMQSILMKALTATSQTCRMYATSHLLVLARFHIDGFEQWGVEALAQQLTDPAPKVVAIAQQVVMEVLTFVPYSKTFAAVLPAHLTSLGGCGVLLQTYAAAVTPKTTGDYEMRKKLLTLWDHEFNLKYVDIIDEKLTQLNTNLSRNPDGSFPRISSSKDWICSHIPMHMYGVLAMDGSGIRLMEERGCIGRLVGQIQYTSLNTHAARKTVRAAIWALAHAASTSMAYNHLIPNSTLPMLIKLTEECAWLSVRGDAIRALNVLAQAGPTLTSALDKLGWFSFPPSYIVPHTISDTTSTGKTSSEFMNDHESVVVTNSPSPLTTRSCTSSIATCASCDLCRLSSSPETCSHTFNNISRPSSVPIYSAKNMDDVGKVCHIYIASCDSATSPSDEKSVKPASVTPIKNKASTRPIRSSSLGNDYPSPRSDLEFTHGHSYATLVEESHESEDPPLSMVPPSPGATDYFNVGSNLAVAKDYVSGSVDSIKVRKTYSFSVCPSPGSDWAQNTCLSYELQPSLLIDNVNTRRSWGLKSMPQDKTFLKKLPTVPNLHQDILYPVEYRMVPVPRFLSDHEATGVDVWRLLKCTGAETNRTTFTNYVHQHAAQCYSEVWPELSAPPRLDCWLFSSTPILCVPIHFSFVVSNVHPVGDPLNIVQNDRITVSTDRSSSASSDRSRSATATSRRTTTSSASDPPKNVTDVFAQFDKHDSDNCVQCSINSTPETESGSSVRKEIIRLVLIMNVRRKYCESGLIRMRQEYSKSFRCLCTYNDVARVLSTCTLHLYARNFVQELFNQVNFEQLWTEPCNIFQVGLDDLDEVENINDILID